jgi:hypothetical protein
MQDRICQVDETSCNARPDHTSGSISTELSCPHHVWSTPDSGRKKTSPFDSFVPNGDIARHLDMREVADKVRDQRLPQPHLGDLEGHKAFTA